MKIASNKAVLKQLIAIMSCHDFREIAAMISMGGMLCLSYRYVQTYKKKRICCLIKWLRYVYESKMDVCFCVGM